MEIKVSDLIDLTEFAYGKGAEGVYPSAGGCDEFIRCFAYEAKITREKLNEFQGRLTGLRSHGEAISLKVIPFGNLWRECPDVKTLSALYLYDQYKKSAAASSSSSA